MFADARESFRARLRRAYPHWDDEAIHRELVRKIIAGDLDYIEEMTDDEFRRWIFEGYAATE